MRKIVTVIDNDDSVAVSVQKATSTIIDDDGQEKLGGLVSLGERTISKSEFSGDSLDEITEQVSKNLGEFFTE